MMERLVYGLLSAMIIYYVVTQLLKNEVTDNLIEQYEIVKRNGSGMDICVAAGAVAMSYLSDGDEANYQRWLAVERRECNP